MIIGFTGTRSGMNESQRKVVEGLLKEHKEVITLVIHGGCVGADEDFHHLSKGMGLKVQVRPCHSANNPMDMTYRFDYSDADEILPSKTHFHRNRDIVNNSDILIATPYNTNKRGGTWYTINYAENPIIIY